MKVAGSVPGGQGVRQGCVWNFEWCTEAQVKPRTRRLVYWRQEAAGGCQSKMRTDRRTQLVESIVPFSSRTTRMAVGSRASKHPMSR